MHNDDNVLTGKNGKIIQQKEIAQTQLHQHIYTHTKQIRINRAKRLKNYVKKNKKIHDFYCHFHDIEN